MSYNYYISFSNVHTHNYFLFHTLKHTHTHTHTNKQTQIPSHILSQTDEDYNTFSPRVTWKPKQDAKNIFDCFSCISQTSSAMDIGLMSSCRNILICQTWLVVTYLVNWHSGSLKLFVWLSQAIKQTFFLIVFLLSSKNAVMSLFRIYLEISISQNCFLSQRIFFWKTSLILIINKPTQKVWSTFKEVITRQKQSVLK